MHTEHDNHRFSTMFVLILVASVFAFLALLLLMRHGKEKDSRIRAEALQRAFISLRTCRRPGPRNEVMACLRMLEEQRMCNALLEAVEIDRLALPVVGVVWCCAMIPVMSYGSGHDPQGAADLECIVNHQLRNTRVFGHIANVFLQPTASTFVLSCAVYGFALVRLHHHKLDKAFRTSLLVLSVLMALALNVVFRESKALRPNTAIPVAVVVAMMMTQFANRIQRIYVGRRAITVEHDMVDSKYSNDKMLG